MKYYYVHGDDYGYKFSVFFKANLIDANEDDIVSEAVSQNLIDVDILPDVDEAKEITKEEYLKGIKG